MTVQTIFQAQGLAAPPKLSERTLLASLTIRAWSARKLDRKVTDEVNKGKGAAADAGRYNKALIAREGLEKIQKLADAARGKHYDMTLPWLDDGSRILNVTAFDEYTAFMRSRKEAYERAVADFVQAYPGYVEAARARLGEMFNAKDYPPAELIAPRFGFDFALMPVADSDDFRAAVGEEQAAIIKADIERRTQEAVAKAMRSAWERVAEKVGRMAERLSAYKPATKDNKAENIFRDSLVENVRDLAKLLPSLNITGDPAMSRIAERLQSDLCRFNAGDLRESDAARQMTAQKAAAILEDVNQFLA